MEATGFNSCETSLTRMFARTQQGLPLWSLVPLLLLDKPIGVQLHEAALI